MYVKGVVATFNQEKALVGASFMIVKVEGSFPSSSMFPHQTDQN